MVDWLPGVSEVDRPGSSSFASVAGLLTAKTGDGEVWHWVLGGGGYGSPLPLPHYLHLAAHCQSDKSSHLVPSFCAFQHNRDQTIWRKRELYDRASPDSLAQWDESGLITSACFLKWLKHFHIHMKLTKEEPALLLLDRLSSHINIDVLEFARNRGIYMLVFPPHCTDRVQPLDVSFFFPLKSVYNKEVGRWIKTNGRRFKFDQVAENFAKTYNQPGKSELAIAGFCITGTYPFNWGVFADHEYYDEENEGKERSNPSNHVPEWQSKNQSIETSPTSELLVSESAPGPSTSRPAIPVTMEVLQPLVDMSAESPKRYSLADLFPLPKLEKTVSLMTKTGKVRKSRKKEAELLTSSSYMKIAQEKGEERKKNLKKKIKSTAKQEVKKASHVLFDENQDASSSRI